MRVDNLQLWLVAATHEERPETSNWDRVVDIIQVEFREVRIKEECTLQTVVLLPKGNGEFRGIGNLEVLRKALPGVANWRIRAAVKIHDVLYGLREGRGTGTAPLKYKLIHQLTKTRKGFLYKVLLDIRKICDTLDREWCMAILLGYGIGPQTERTP